MEAETKQKIQWALIAAFVLASLRTGYIFYRRHEDRLEEQKQALARQVGYSNEDYYVNPKKLHPYDLKSARAALTAQPEWVQLGYAHAYFPVVGKSADFGKSAGSLGPLEKLQVTDVIEARAPGAPDPQVLAVFEKDGKHFAVPIGTKSNDEYHIYSDDIFFIQDPHELYKHWPPEIWQAVDHHEVKPGMNELQTAFAIGLGVPDDGATSYEKTVRYPNDGKPLVVVFRSGKVAEVSPGTSSS